MNLTETLISVWQQALVDEQHAVRIGKKSHRVELLRKKNLRLVEFEAVDHSIAGIEQNPNTQSQWARMAREGKRIMQFRCENRYIANVAEGKVTRYGGWKSLQLPD
ncbi:MAG: hypothetical protein HY046_12035 [Acidobacteria bacterium]|nr:hypothetical protein [Acidobacteriota bacterium]